MRIWLVVRLLILLPCLVSAEESYIYTDNDLGRYSTDEGMNYMGQTSPKVKPIKQSEYTAAEPDHGSAERPAGNTNETVIGGSRGGCQIISTSITSVG